MSGHHFSGKAEEFLCMAVKICVTEADIYLCSNRALAITSRKHVTKHFRLAKKVSCPMAAEQKLVSNSQSLCNIHWIYTAR